ncbi:unnamed protein product, partial [Ixodes hexagonus]
LQVSYPRSGTHWMQQIVLLILSKGHSLETYIEFMERAPFLEMQELKTTESPRLLRTHFPVSKLRLNEKAKYIYVARNPWDCCVSLYHLLRERPANDFANGIFDDFLGAFLDAKVGFGDYFDHVISGYSHRGDPNVFFVTYEEIQRNKEVVLRLATFLGEDHRKVLEQNENILEQVLEKSTVGFMKNFMKTSNKIFLDVVAKIRPIFGPPRPSAAMSFARQPTSTFSVKVRLEIGSSTSLPETSRKCRLLSSSERGARISCSFG